MLSDRKLSNIDDRTYIALRCEAALMSAVIGQMAQMIGGSLSRDTEGQWIIKTGHGHYGTWYIAPEEVDEEYDDSEIEDIEDVAIWHEPPAELRDDEDDEDDDEDEDDENASDD